MEKHDLIIIGGSAVGTAAAVYGVRAEIDLKLVASDLGGEVANAGEIQNWPSINETTGIDLSQKFNDQLKFNNVPTDTGVKVTSLAKEGNVFHITGDKAGEKVAYEARAVIIGTGAHPRHLGVPGEEEYYQKGLSYCTTCDGPLFKGKVTATIGGGNGALESAIMMAGIASKVYLINKNEKFKGEAIYVSKLEKLPNVEIIPQAMTSKILGDHMVNGVEYTDKNGTTRVLHDVAGVFVHIGLVPNADFVDIVAKDKSGQIITDKLGQTNVPGLYAAGDVTDIPFNQISIAAGQGVTALLSAQQYLNQQED